MKIGLVFVVSYEFLLIVLYILQIKVMHTQLLLFHNAVAAYFSGNAELLEDTLNHFNIKVTKSPSNETPSWLERFIDKIDNK